MLKNPAALSARQPVGLGKLINSLRAEIGAPSFGRRGDPRTRTTGQQPSGMVGRLMLQVADRLDLEGAVLHVEVAAQTFPELVENLT